ncbi:unnamed protein product [Dicrocoelium dendriticum]|nr:unnamed protein product [Dicrocoelium dendriticum]
MASFLLSLGHFAHVFLPCFRQMEAFVADSEGDSLIANVNIATLSDVGQRRKPSQLDFEDTHALRVRDTFVDFPYPVIYPQQLALMKTIYSTLVHRKCGLFESPTGTGKSLSLLTAALRWLLDYNSQIPTRIQHLMASLSDQQPASNACEMDWVSAYDRLRIAKRQLEPEINHLTRIQSCLDSIANLKASNLRPLPAEFVQMTNNLNENLQNSSLLYPLSRDECFGTELTDEEFLLPESEEPFEEPVATGEHNLPRIIYCSRTHSQLTQLLDELARCPTLADKITVVQLSSRQSLCTNNSVYRLSHPGLIDEACLELKRLKNRCPMRNMDLVKSLSNYLLAGARASEIASAVREGRFSDLFGSQTNNLRSETKELASVRIGCPYYAARRSLPLAQLVLIPYASLLQPKTRVASGLCLRDAVVIVDEAHNLLDATTSCISTLLQASDLQNTLDVFRAYQTHYRTRFSALLSLRLRQLIHFSQQLLSLLSSGKRAEVPSVRIVTVSKLLAEADVDNVSLFQLIDCLRTKHFVTKLAGFARWYSTKSCASLSLRPPLSHGSSSGMRGLLAGMKRNCPDTTSLSTSRPSQSILSEVNTNSVELLTRDGRIGMESSSSALFRFKDFLEAINSPEDDARIVISLNNQNEVDFAHSSAKEPSFYFTILNPGKYLRDLVRESRCLLLAGGTMQPFDDLIEQVFLPADLPMDRITTFVCDHVINPSKQLAVYPVAKSPVGNALQFTYHHRCLPSVMDDCGDIILQICAHTPAGVVVFLPSYDYQHTICAHWESTGMMDKLSRCKRTFREPKNSGSLTQIMQAYKAAATNDKTGALLICVIGGKLSEGINFSDDLARSVILIGMPYPNPRCPLLREKMAYLDRTFSKSNTSLGSISPGRRHYESLCMRAINQAIGRAVRHVNDYAAVFLVDSRFAQANIQKALPGWVLESLRMCIAAQSGSIDFENALRHLKLFFAHLRST